MVYLHGKIPTLFLKQFMLSFLCFETKNISENVGNIEMRSLTLHSSSHRISNPKQAIRKDVYVLKICYNISRSQSVLKFIPNKT